MIVGVTGKYCSGKDSVGEYLVNKGFIHISLSDILREEARKRGLQPTRDTLIALGNELRALNSPSVLADRALAKTDSGDYVISSIRNPAEVRALRERKDFILIWLDGPQELRFQRMVARGREGENSITFEEFRMKESSEHSSDPHRQQFHEVKKLANVTIMNDADINDMFRKIDNVLSSFRDFLSRPDSSSA